jgi:5-amino-6-(5-phospho-D-ribitylamino)uracil phosphatase
VLFAFDLDNTIVTSDYQLPQGVAAAVRGLRDAGHAVTVLTGRPLASARPFLETLGVMGPYSVNHGAQVMAAGGRELRRTRLRAADVRALIEPWRLHPTVEFSCIVDDNLYVKNPDDDRWHWAHTESRLVSPFDPAVDLDADKVVFAAAATGAEVAEHVAGHLPACVRYLWGDGFLEVIGEGADKGTGLALIAQELGYAQHEVVAFGDGLNDVTMLAWAGRSVAVGPHAVQDVLNVADEHIAAPEEGGVTDWIERNGFTESKAA